jgi:Rieske Fe-S protein
MRMSWEGEEPNGSGWTRREWAKLAIAAGAASSIAAMAGTISGQLLPPPMKFEGEMREQLYYTKWPTEAWWNSRQGRVIRVADFEEWKGASGVWRGLFLGGQWVPGTGYPVLVIRVKYDAPEFVVATDLAPPDGFSFYYDDPNQKVRIVAFFDRCAHLCCPPGWHVIADTKPYRDYLVPSPTYSVYHQDPIFCVCHGSQYDPLLLTTNVHPRSGIRYLGARHIHGPTQRALPVVPFRVENEVLVGGMPDPRWYEYC